MTFPVAPAVAGTLAALVASFAQQEPEILPTAPPAPKQRTTFFEKSEAPLPPEVYCKVDGFPITRAEYGDWLQKHRGDLYIQNFVTGVLVRRAAKSLGIEPPPEEVEALVTKKMEERAVAAYRGNRDLFIQQEITQFGKTLEQWKVEQAYDVETEVLVSRSLKKRRLTTDADVEKEFKRLYGASGRELWLRAILLELDVPSVTSHKPPAEIQRQADEAIQKAFNKGVTIVKRLQGGGIDFASAALAYSDDGRSKTKGGDIGKYSGDPPMFGAEFDAAVHKAKVGQLIGPVRIQAGFVVAEITREQVHDLRAERDKLRKALGEREPTFDEATSYVADLILNAKLVR